MAFLNNIWDIIQEDSQYLLKEVQDWAVHLEYLQSMLQEFDGSCAPLKRQLRRIFYTRLGLSINLWIDKVGQKQLP